MVSGFTVVDKQDINIWLWHQSQGQFDKNVSFMWPREQRTSNWTFATNISNHERLMIFVTVRYWNWYLNFWSLLRQLGRWTQCEAKPRAVLIFPGLYWASQVVAAATMITVVVSVTTAILLKIPFCDISGNGCHAQVFLFFSFILKMWSNMYICIPPRAKSWILHLSYDLIWVIWVPFDIMVKTI